MSAWRTLPAQPPSTYQLAICPKCCQVLVLRLPEHTFHRHLEAARGGGRPLTHCPRCDWRLSGRNWTH